MASSISDAQAELISSLSPDDIPIKLRCAICSKLAVNAFRLPCCEQAICETCQCNLPASCPVCEHSPLCAEDCNPNKSLRTTIRVFLRTAEKKREANRPKQPKPPAPDSPVDATKPSMPVAESTAKEDAANHDANGTAPAQEAHAPPRAQNVTPGADKPLATRPDTGTSTGLTSQKEQEFGDAPGLQQGDRSSGLRVPASEETVEARDVTALTGPNQTTVVEAKIPEVETGGQSGYGTDGGFPNNMMFPGSGDFNQMQMMMSMQNGMGGNSFGGFPMMGMGMDPMTMQNMYMNGGFQGMGMNGMGGYGGGFGQGSNNNWNGSQSWNFDQNNYNQSGLGMGTGDYGNFNAGFQTGYNQGNYGQFNDYRRNNFGRGRGRGRGYSGGPSRGGYHQDGGMANHQDQGYQSQHGSGHFTQGQVVSDAKGDSGDGKPASEHGTGLARQPGEQGSQGTGQKPGQGGDADAVHADMGQLASRERLGSETAGNVPHSKGAGTSELGAIRSVLSTPDVPINAPTGPKAMRQGLPNTSLHHLRARGYQVDAAPASAGTVRAEQQAAPDGASGPRSRSPERENDKTTGSSRDHSRGPSVGHDVPPLSRDGSASGSRKGDRAQIRSRSRSRKGSHRQGRRRSPSSDIDEMDDSHRRKKARSSRRQDDDEHQSPKEGKYAEKPRPASPDESRKPGHRSHKDKEHDGRRDRDRHREDDRQKSSHRNRRSNDRDRERDRDRDFEHSQRRDRDGDRDKERRDRKERHREKDRERDHRHGSSTTRPSVSRGSSSLDKAVEPPSGPRGQSGRVSGSRASHDHRSDRDQHDPIHGGAGKVGATKHPHTLEREARNRERLLKEAQRMAGYAGLAGSKRGRDSSDDGGRKNRRPSRRSETRDGDEERMRRLEAEREGGRWD